MKKMIVNRGSAQGVLVDMTEENIAQNDIDKGYMYGTIGLMGSYETNGLRNLPKFIGLDFVKMSKDEPWKLITYKGHIEDYFTQYDPDDAAETPKPLSLDLQIYIRSKFQTIEEMVWLRNISKE